MNDHLNVTTGQSNPSLQTFPIGTIIKGRYVIESLLGAGCSGYVYKCRDKKLGSLRVALKVLPAQMGKDRVKAKRIQREILASYVIDHPNVTRFYDCVRTEDVIGVVMEYVEGENLRSIMSREASLTLSEVRRILRGVCAGLEELHKHKLIHRDLKPANILISTNGIVKVTDLGLARRERSSSTDPSVTFPGRILSLAGLTKSMTENTDVIGTPYYLSPEYLQGHEATHLSDIYSLGIIAYELVAGAEPFCSSNIEIFLEEKMAGAPLTPRDLNPNCPKELSDLIVKMMHCDPTRRFRSVREIQVELSNLSIRPTPPRTKPRPNKPVSKRRGIISHVKELLGFGARTRQRDELFSARRGRYAGHHQAFKPSYVGDLMFAALVGSILFLSISGSVLPRKERIDLRPEEPDLMLRQDRYRYFGPQRGQQSYRIVSPPLVGE